MEPRHTECRDGPLSAAPIPPGTVDVSLTHSELARLNEIVSQRLGIQLPPRKLALVRGRLERHVQELGLSSFADYCAYILSDNSGRAMDDLANRISTNHTFFFREPAHFDFLAREVLPDLTVRLRRQGERDLRIWSAGCATGEEAYTLAMVLLDALGNEFPAWTAGLLATDVSSRALKVARAGIYAEERLHDLPPMLRARYFRRVNDDLWEVLDRLRAEVTFRRFNLMNSTFPFRRPFHVIFCRNVMIYFDAPTRAALAARLAGALSPGGHLFVGHSESLGRETPGLRFLRPAIYQRETR